MSWRFDWITSWDEIWAEAFVAKWHEWMGNSPTAHVFFHPTFVRIWVDTYMPLRRIEPRFLVATGADCTVFLPMVLWRTNWKSACQRLLVPVGYSDYDYHDPIVVGEAGDHLWDEFWGELLKHVGGRPFGYDAVEVTGIHQSLACSHLLVEEPDICPKCDLTGFDDGEAFLGSLSKSLRGDIRRQRRRMSEIGEVAYRVLGPGDTCAATAALDGLLTTHRERWPQAYKAPNFHANLVKHGLPASLVHLSMLELAGHAVAWHLGFVYASRFYYYMPAHDSEYANLSPGKILLYCCVRDAIERGLGVFDHLRGEENYKAGWTDSVDCLYMLRAEGNSFGSVIRNVCADHIKPALMRRLR